MIDNGSGGRDDDDNNDVGVSNNSSDGIWDPLVHLIDAKFHSYYPDMPLQIPIPPPLHTSASKGKEGCQTEILLLTTSAAANRNEEATLMFQNIACILDDAISEDHLPQHLRKPLRDFVVDLTSVAPRHYDSHVRGTIRPLHPYSTPQPGSTLPANIVNPNVATFPAVPAVALPKRSSTYASVASAPHQPQ
ncbi:hypothetical protein K3495_g4337 [Podosphaera aphanis]|nr:hypothetical protein K3495_g4337 [Podosphaera aphanis]